MLSCSPCHPSPGSVFHSTVLSLQFVQDPPSSQKLERERATLGGTTGFARKEKVEDAFGDFSEEADCHQPVCKVQHSLSQPRLSHHRNLEGAGEPHARSGAELG